MIRQHLSHIRNNHQSQNKWKTEISLAINSVSSMDFNEAGVMHTNSDNIDIFIGSKTDENIEKFLKSFFEI